MRRRVMLACAAIAFAGCDKLRKKHEDASTSGSGSAEPPKTGHSVTKLKADAGTGSGSGSAHAGSAHAGSAQGSAHAEHLMGGDGSPSYRADDGRVHGPGGPVFMGRGVQCDAAHDHCLRDGVWFSVNSIQPGKLYRAVPVYEFEKQWYTWRGELAEPPVKLYKTQIAGNAKLAPGTSVIWYSSETSDGKWSNSEYEAMTSSRWEAGVVESQQSATVVMIKGFGATTLDTVRLITAQRDP